MARLIAQDYAIHTIIFIAGTIRGQHHSREFAGFLRLPENGREAASTDSAQVTSFREEVTALPQAVVGIGCVCTLMGTALAVNQWSRPVLLAPSARVKGRSHDHHCLTRATPKEPLTGSA